MYVYVCLYVYPDALRTSLGIRKASHYRYLRYVDQPNK